MRLSGDVESTVNDVEPRAGGFAGYFGSGTLANVGGIKLLGLPLLKIDSLLSVGQMIETFAVESTVSGVASGYSVSTQNEKGYSGGFIGECISGRARDTKISNLKTVTASAVSGNAGGFAGFAKAGDALSAGGFHYITTDRNRIGEPARRCQCPETGVQ